MRKTIPNYSLSQRRIMIFSQWNEPHCSLLILCTCRQVGSEPQNSETILTVSILATKLLQARRVCSNLLSYWSCLTWWKKVIQQFPLISSQFSSLCFFLSISTQSFIFVFSLESSSYSFSLSQHSFCLDAHSIKKFWLKKPCQQHVFPGTVSLSLWIIHNNCQQFSLELRLPRNVVQGSGKSLL